MDNQLDNLDLGMLTRMHRSATFKMQQALISGASWDEVQHQKAIVVDLAVAIHKKQPSYFLNPAEAPNGRQRPSGDEGGSPH
jgi:hypothetical protein